MSTNFRKNLSIFIFIMLFISGLFCTSQSYSVKAATTSSKSSIASETSKVAATKSTNSKTTSPQAQSNTKSNSKESSNQSESLLPSDGNSLPPAAAQNWDQIMSDINKTADKDEFTFTEEPSHLGFWGSKLSYMGFGLILLAVLGFTYFFYSTFFSKKSPRKLKKLVANNSSSNRNINSYYPNKQVKPRGNNTSNKSVYSDGYGYTRTPQQTARPVKKSVSNKTNQAPNPNLRTTPKVQKNINLDIHDNPPKAKHMLEDDADNIIMSNDNSSKNINNFSNKARTNRRNYSKKNKKDEFWNDFFLN